MYVFREFNEKHKGLVRNSIVLHLIAVVAVWGSAFFLLDDARAALNAALTILLAIHILYIANLTNSYDIALTGKQYFVTLWMSLAVALILLFAYFRSAGNVFGWDAFKTIVLWLGLATCLAVYIDFAIASLLRPFLSPKKMG